MLDKLTKEQEVLMEEVRDEWIKRFNSLEFDEEKARKLIEKLYKIGKLKKPIVIILDSPWALQVACNLVGRSQVLNQVRDQVESQVSSQVRNQVESQVSDQVRDQVESQVLNQVRDQVESQVLSQARDQVWSQVTSQVWSQVSDQVRDQVWSQVSSQVTSQVESQVSDQVRDQVWSQVENQVTSQVWSQVNSYFSESYYGRCDDLYWIAYYNYFERIGIVKNKLFTELKELFKCNLFTSIQLEDICFVSKPPIFLNRDEKGNMHSTEDYAIYFKDGFGLHYVHGIYFSEEDFKRFVKGRNASAKEIINIKNTEQKAVLIKVYGYEKILNEVNGNILDTYEKKSEITGKLTKCELIEFEVNKNLKQRVICVEDHTTHKKTFLGVPREKSTETCIGALAWTFGIENYNLELES